MYVILENPFQLIFIIFQPCYNDVGGRRHQPRQTLIFSQQTGLEFVSSKPTSQRLFHSQQQTGQFVAELCSSGLYPDKLSITFIQFTTGKTQLQPHFRNYSVLDPQLSSYLYFSRETRVQGRGILCIIPTFDW